MSEADVIRARELLDFLCRDSLETPLATVLAHPEDDGHISTAFRDLAAALASLEARCETAEGMLRSDEAAAYLAESEARVASLEAERDALRNELANVACSAGVPDYVHRNVEAALGARLAQAEGRDK